MTLPVFSVPLSAPISAPSFASLPRIHGGPDALGAPRYDFSTNSNACGPCPIALAAVQQADATRYPDATYAALRSQLAAFHGVDVQRVLLAGSASEFIFRLTAWVAGQGGTRVCLPPHGYGDYAQAAQGWGLAVTDQPDAANLVWACEPSSPLGGPHGRWPKWLLEARTGNDLDRARADHPLAASPPGKQTAVHPVPLVLDCAYAPLRLSGVPSQNEVQRNQVWQLWTPNKALGLTGVRAAYAIAPLGAQASVAALDRLCASWPVGAHGVAMLQAWVQPEVQTWLAGSLQTLNDWKTRQIAMLQALGWTCLPSDANFFCARPPLPLDLQALRAAGIKLRDATSFGLPCHVRLGVLPPAAQDALSFICASN